MLYTAIIDSLSTHYIKGLDTMTAKRVSAWQWLSKQDLTNMPPTEAAKINQRLNDIETELILLEDLKAMANNFREAYEMEIQYHTCALQRKYWEAARSAHVMMEGEQFWLKKAMEATETIIKIKSQNQQAA